MKLFICVYLSHIANVHYMLSHILLVFVFIVKLMLFELMFI